MPRPRPLVLLISAGARSSGQALDALGQPFHDPVADAALFDALTAGLAGQLGHAQVRLASVVRDEHINDPGFADAAVGHLLELLARTAPNP